MIGRFATQHENIGERGGHRMRVTREECNMLIAYNMRFEARTLKHKKRESNTQLYLPAYLLHTENKHYWNDEDR